MEVSEGDALLLGMYLCYEHRYTNCSWSTRQARFPKATSCHQRNIVSVLEGQFHAADHTMIE